MSIVFTRQKSDFALIDGTDRKIVIENACLRVRKVRAVPAVLAGHEEGALKDNFTFPHLHTDMLTYTIPSGVTYYMQDNLSHGLLPKLVIVAMLLNKDFVGGGKNSPMRFTHNNISQIALQRDGENVPYSRPIEMDWSTGSVTHAYMAMFQNLELFNGRKTNGITMKKFIEYYPIFVFNLTPDLSANGAHIQPCKTGNLRLETKFASSLPESINVIVMSVRDGHITINKNREVSTP